MSIEVYETREVGRGVYETLEELWFSKYKEWAAWYESIDEGMKAMSYEKWKDWMYAILSEEG